MFHFFTNWFQFFLVTNSGRNFSLSKEEREGGRAGGRKGEREESKQ